MIVIPARIESSRFPRKVLADINGVPMVIATANRVKDIDKVLIATDSQEVLEVAKSYGFEAVMTSSEHKSGTDRINEAVTSLNLDDDEIVINVQADEPFIEKEVVQKLHDRVVEIGQSAMMVSCYNIIEDSRVDDPNLVKVILDCDDFAIYFSRSRIPYSRGDCENYYGHLGLYGFSVKSLREFCALPLAPLEDIEKLEQLRAIYHGKKIAMVQVLSESFGIDTKEDLKRAMLKK
ncbi:MAG TPA: 3-deoxy-manno-octulosonate cytidylyltransferase [Campylobacterales bacterium]|nr:3-deoxy-manno-octulosonate cytidylyltransferase [Campylobacterales bacterium]